MFLTRQWAKYSLVQSANRLIPHLYNFYPEHSFFDLALFATKVRICQRYFLRQADCRISGQIPCICFKQKYCTAVRLVHVCVCVEGDIFLHIKRRQNNFLRNLTSRDRAPRLAPF